MWHISSEPLVVEPCSFLVPKASPIHASKIEITYLYKFMTNSSFQTAFSQTISRLLNTGIYQKLERDITTVETAYRDLFDIQWIPKQLGQTDPLTIGHTLPSFLSLGIGLILATFVFILDLCRQCKKKSVDRNGVSHVDTSTSSHPPALSKVVVNDLKTMNDQQNIGNLI